MSLAVFDISVPIVGNGAVTKPVEGHTSGAVRYGVELEYATLQFTKFQRII